MDSPLFGGFSASSLWELEKLWNDAVGRSKARGGPAFSGLNNKHLRAHFRSVTEGFEGFTRAAPCKRLRGAQSGRGLRRDKKTCYDFLHAAAVQLHPGDPNRVLKLSSQSVRWPQRDDVRPPSSASSTDGCVIKTYKAAVQNKNRDQKWTALSIFAGSHSIRATTEALGCSEYQAKKGRTLSKVGLTLGMKSTVSTRLRLPRRKAEFLQSFALEHIVQKAFSRTEKFELLRPVNRNRLFAKYERACEAAGASVIDRGCEAAGASGVEAAGVDLKVTLNPKP